MEDLVYPTTCVNVLKSFEVLNVNTVSCALILYHFSQLYNFKVLVYVVRKTFNLMEVTTVLATWTLLVALFSVLKELRLNFLLNLNILVSTQLDYSNPVRNLSVFFVSFFK